MTNELTPTTGFDMDAFAGALLAAITSKVNAQPVTHTVIETAPIVQAPPVDKNLEIATKFENLVLAANTATLRTHPASVVELLKSLFEDIRNL